MADVIGSKRANSASPCDEENDCLTNEEKRPRRVGERRPLTNQANYITVSVPDDGRRTRVSVRNVDHFRQERYAEENFLVWTCSKSWRDLKEVANALMVRAEQTLANANLQSIQTLPNRTNVSTELWLRKYAPASYMDLVSDEATNRIVLQWFRLWDKSVFGKERKSKPYSSSSERDKQQQQQQGLQGKWSNNRFNPQGGHHKQGPIGPSMDPTETWPAQRICLLTGPPGLGKTTLAHIVARHCGYEIVEVNASDDRSAQVFRDYLESVVETRGMLNVARGGETKQAKPRPACLVLDEIDGAPQAAVDVLISYVTAGDSEKAEKKTRKKGKKELRRPVICICNDQYATSLRNLRRHCFVVSCLSPPPERLVFRVGDIARRERIEIESNAVSTIVERARGDIRVCINILQTLKATCSCNADHHHLQTTQRRVRDVTRITNDQIARLPRLGFNKDVEQSMFDCLQTVFKLPPVTSNTNRYETVQNSVQMNTDHELLVNGIFENYLNARIRDDFLIAASQMADWLAITDTMQNSAMSIAGAEIGYAMTYTTTPLIATACHFMFANSQPGRLTFPKLSMEMRQLQTQRHNLLRSFLAGVTPTQRTYFSSPVAVVFDLLPSLLDIVQPTLRPVSSQLFSSVERAEIARVVEIMASLGLTFVQRLSAPSNEQKWQSRGSQLGFYLEPPVDSLVLFERRPDPSEMFKMANPDEEGANKATHLATAWRLPQAVRQLFASEITLYLARRAAVKASGPLLQPYSDNSDPVMKNDKKAPSTATAAGLAQTDKASELLMKQFDDGANGADQKVQTTISSFFTRTTTSKKNATGNSAFSALIRSPPTGRSRDKIWYRFNEGFSNAVRRPVRVKQFF